MSPKLKLLVAAAISVVPLNALRVWLYTHLLHYRFGPGARIGLRVVIAVDAFEAGEKLAIRRSNVFEGPFSVRLGDRCIIGRFNRFDCGQAAALPSARAKQYGRALVVGDDCLIHEGHLFDVYGTISVGTGTWVAGFGSQFLTHGASAADRDITIGARCYLGSAVRFAPGSGLGDEVMLGMGAVVSRRLEGDRVVVAGVPARVVRAREAGDQYVFERNW